MLKDVVGEILFQADLDHSPIITIPHIKRSLCFLLLAKRSRGAIVWGRHVLVASRLKKKVMVRRFRHTRDSIFKILFLQKASQYVFKNDALVFLAAVIEYLHDH